MRHAIKKTVYSITLLASVSMSQIQAHSAEELNFDEDSQSNGITRALLVTCPTGSAKFCNVCVQGNIIAGGTISALGGFIGAGITGGSGNGATGATGATGVFSGNGALHITDTTASTGFCVGGSTGSNFGNATGALLVDGGVAIGGDLNVAGYINTCSAFQISNVTTLQNFADNPADPGANYNRALSIGFIAGKAITPAGTTSANTFVGNFAGTQTDATAGGNYNTFIGDKAGTYNISGYSNTSVGQFSMYYANSGNFNSGFGENALSHNTLGNHNTAMGSESLFKGSGSGNAALGFQALYFCNDNYNVGVGFRALTNSVTGSGNVAVGYGALYSSNESYALVAVGAGALYHTTAAHANVGVGGEALYFNVTGAANTAIGYQSMFGNTIGNNNVGVGYRALGTNTTGIYNTAVGSETLINNTIGVRNTAVGHSACSSNVVGNYNCAFGEETLFSNAGSNNSAFGARALTYVSGSYNIALGKNSGYNVRGGSNTIEIGNKGREGDDSLIRIGSDDATYGPVQTACYIAGINGYSPDTYNTVVIAANGRLGIYAGPKSAARTHDKIQPMPNQTDKIMKLRPVNFHYKSDLNERIAYGLVAEEVNEIYPEVVIRDADGEISSVNYNKLIPMLLAQIQTLQKENENLTAHHNDQAATITRLDKEHDTQIARIDEQAMRIDECIQAIKNLQEKFEQLHA